MRAERLKLLHLTSKILIQLLKPECHCFAIKKGNAKDSERELMNAMKFKIVGSDTNIKVKFP